MKRKLFFPAIASLLAGCMVGRDYQPPSTTVPTTFSPVAQQVASTNNAASDLAQWWDVFNDPRLSELVSQSVRSNLDLRIAQARLREARAQRGIQHAALFPEVNGSGQYARQRLSEKSFSGKQVAAAGQSLESDLFDAAVDMSWEIDIFGGRRRVVQSAQAQVEANIEAVRGTLVSTVSEVALSYLELRGAQKQLAVARDNLRAQEQTLALTKDRFQAGLSGELDVTRAAAQVGRTRAQIPSLEDASQRAVHRIALLLGKYPSELDTELHAVSAIPTPPPRVPLGLPSELLKQRPDIRQAERELAAATADVAAAVAEWYPKFYLTGAAGLESVEAKDFFTAGANFWSIGPGIRWPIFNAGRIRQNVRVHSAREEQALLRYEQSVLTALTETEDALLAFGKEQERYAALAESEEASRRSVALADDRYRSGLADFLDVLEADRSLFASQDDLVQSERHLAQNLVRIYKALGGGWQNGSSATVAAQRKPDLRIAEQTDAEPHSYSSLITSSLQ